MNSLDSRSSELAMDAYFIFMDSDEFCVFSVNCVNSFSSYSVRKYEFDSSLLEVIDGVVDKISRGNLSAANSELERVKSLIAKRYKLVRFADKSPAGWTAIEEYESDELADDSEDESYQTVSRD
ncbi:hypothetical protein P5673_032381 [Acropora cervicornis]|uniref:Uncharacterized protein n=1 Tax=Acropora cervicornis TaxID=6130 RepID=A0AAD9PRC0_ACRCE|nr:hypothetical protein P5673_032381 [Acropora cervicornis]